jgi:hypothetical protein
MILGELDSGAVTCDVFVPLVKNKSGLDEQVQRLDLQNHHLVVQLLLVDERPLSASRVAREAPVGDGVRRALFKAVKPSPEAQEHPSAEVLLVADGK